MQSRGSDAGHAKGLYVGLQRTEELFSARCNMQICRARVVMLGMLRACMLGYRELKMLLGVYVLSLHLYAYIFSYLYLAGGGQNKT
jgi:hypothetical protein